MDNLNGSKPPAIKNDLRDALAKLDAMPLMALHLTNASRASITPEDEASDPTLRPILETAIADFKSRLDKGEPCHCMLCPVSWEMNTPTPVKVHGLAIVCEAVEFRRASNDRSPMLIFGLCQNCTADQRTLRSRVLAGLQTLWPSMRSMPGTNLPPTSTRSN